MSVKVDSKTSEVLSIVNNQVDIALRLILEDTHAFSNGITPQRTGDLRARVSKSVDGKQGVIQWNTPYAIYQENPKKSFKYTTPGTGPHFAEKSIAKAMEGLPVIVAKAGMK